MVPVRRAGVPPERTIIAGFSQGAAMALRLSLTNPPLACVALGGFLTQTHQLHGVAQGKNFPVFIGHGGQDTVVHPCASFDVEEFLLGAGFNRVTRRLYGCGHGVPPEMVRDVAAFLRSLV